MTACALVDQLDGLLRRSKPAAPPDACAPEWGAFLGRLATLVEGEIGAHFRFEEERLFPYLAERGEADIGELLVEEHQTIVPLGERIATLARQAAREGFAPEAWSEFRRLGAELGERLLSHVQKEEMALLPLLEDALDDDADAELAADAASRR